MPTEASIHDPVPVGAILAGGLSRRMEGPEKTLLELDGQPLVQRIRDRLAAQCGDILLDALYGYNSTFQNFITRQRNAFFVSAYAQSTAEGNAELRASLEAAGIPAANTMPTVLNKGTVAVISAPVLHRDYVTRAWTPFPIADVLQRIPSLGRIAPPDRYASR